MEFLSCLWQELKPDRLALGQPPLLSNCGGGKMKVLKELEAVRVE
jgi:hypothetical protein